jgi:hypothetical protein
MMDGQVGVHTGACSLFDEHSQRVRLLSLAEDVERILPCECICECGIIDPERLRDCII